MDEAKLKSIIGGELADALGSQLSGSKSANLSAQRQTNMEYYLGLPFGNEQEGRSQVVSTDVMDTIEWIKPSLLRIFTLSDKAVSFEPFGPEDEEQADQETDYVNYVFYKENNGFLILTTWFTDALIQKNGYVKLYPEKSQATSVETYEGLSDDEFTIIITDDELEPLEHEERVLDLEGQPVRLHDIKVRRSTTETKICIVPVPPEEVLVSRKTLSIDINQSPFVAHRSKKTISDLISLGYDRSQLENVGSAEVHDTPERLARFNFDGTYPDHVDEIDPSMREVWVNECYLKVDYDGDGIAELRRVVMVGNEILDNEETDIIPFAALTPIVLPHKHHGLAYADTVKDLQLWRSALLRQILDNTYLANNQRVGVVGGRANVDDLLEGRMGAIVRMQDPNAVVPLPYNPLPPQSMALYELSEGIKENRTGVTRYNQGTNADSLNKTATGINQIMTASQQRVELVARIFAETGVKDLFTKLHGYLIKYSDKKKIVKLRNKYVSVDPREWRTRYNVNIAVGLGTGNKEQTVTSLVTILNMQKEDAISGGMGTMLTPANLYYTRRKIVEAMGFKDSEMFYTDPATLQPPPPPPDPNMLALQMQAKAEQDKRQVDMIKIQSQEKIKAAELQLEKYVADLTAQINNLKAQLELEKARAKVAESQQKTVIEHRNAETEKGIQELQLMLQNQQELSRQAIDKYRAELQSMTTLHTAQLAARQKEMDSHMKNYQSLQKTSADIFTKLKALENKETGPKKVTYDEKGRIISVGGRKVKRDEKGRAVEIH